MNLLRLKSILLVFITSSAFAGDEENTTPINPNQSENPPSTQKNRCKKGAPYKCFCARRCSYRDIQDNDDPIWHEGICYCKEWDRKKYYERCIAEEK